MFTVERMNRFYNGQSFKEGLGTLPANVLLAQHDSDMRGTIGALLRGEGYEVVEAENGSDFLTQLRLPYMGEPWNVIISDAYLTVVTGLKVMKSLRESDSITPFIMITALDDQISRAEAQRLGATAIFDDPFCLEDFRITVKGLIAP